jgi:hypothetical protein
MRVRVEHLDEPLGIGDRRPRLSWQLPDGTRQQHAYELRLDDGTTTGRVDSAESVLVAWPGRPLSSRERREVQVRVWTDQGETPWSEPTVLETGLLEPSDWVSSWVQPVEHEQYKAGFRPAYLLRGEVDVPKLVVAARLYVTAHGLYEAYVNGARVGDLELTPGYTEYASRLHVQTYDVTAMVREGSNALGAVLADGWFRGEVGLMRSFDQWASGRPCSHRCTSIISTARRPWSAQRKAGRAPARTSSPRISSRGSLRIVGWCSRAGLKPVSMTTAGTWWRRRPTASSTSCLQRRRRSGRSRRSVRCR